MAWLRFENAACSTKRSSLPTIFSSKVIAIFALAIVNLSMMIHHTSSHIKMRLSGSGEYGKPTVPWIAASRIDISGTCRQRDRFQRRSDCLDIDRTVF